MVAREGIFVSTARVGKKEIGEIVVMEESVAVLWGICGEESVAVVGRKTLSTEEKTFAFFEPEVGE